MNEIPSLPAVHCCVCNQKAKMEVKDGWYPGNLGYKRLMNTPNTEGWMRLFHPWSEPAIGSVIHESKWLCPPCAMKVQDFLVHIANPIGDSDL